MDPRAGTDHDDAGSQPGLPETPHELHYDRARIDGLMTRVRDGARIDLREALLDAVDWSDFRSESGQPVSPLEQAQLADYYRRKFADVGPLYLAELLSTEFMTEQRARGDVVFSDRLLDLGRTEPELWAEIRRFFQRKEMVTALLAAAHQPGTGDSDDAEPAAKVADHGAE
ncbi:MAG: hypothetical protein M3411_02050 [Chloroflexota bacterium]|jgi:hypothetical protein|nr:hypothetical protein [Chloroflexia bacterium]MDQ3467001.1 hypothetical protein [Chloroflexota bacterium]